MSRDILIGVDRDKKELKDFTKKEIALVEKREKCDFCEINIENDFNFHPDEEVLNASCSMCYYSEHLDKVRSIDKGVMILMPELNQQTLNSLVRFIWFLEGNQDEENFEGIDTLMGLYDQIKEREYFMESYYCDGSNDVDKIINAMHNLSIEKYRKRNIGFDGLIWLPSKEVFEDKMKSWESLFNPNYNFENFDNIINKIKGSVNG